MINSTGRVATRPLHSACWPDTSVLVRARWSLAFIAVQKDWLVLLVTAALLKQKLTVRHREIEKRKVGREEEMKARKYKLFWLYVSDTDRKKVPHFRFVSSSLLQFHFPPTSHSGRRNSSISFDSPLHYYYFTALKQFIFYHFLILAHLPFLCP